MTEPRLARMSSSARSFDSGAVTASSFFPVFLFLGSEVQLQGRETDDLELDAALGTADDLALVDVVLVDLDLRLALRADCHSRISTSSKRRYATLLLLKLRSYPQ